MMYALRRAGALLAAALVAACGGGGGAGAGTNTEAVVASVAVPVMLETNGTQQMIFTVTLDKPAASGVTVVFSTVSTAKSGGGSTGFATGGANCTAGVDYITRTGGTLLIRAGDRSGEIPVTLCGDTTFEPLETYALNWSAPGQSGTVVATILNDDAGGLNGTGVAGSFGRDSSALTSSGADGRLGFSFATVAGTGLNCLRDNVTGLLWEGKTGGNANTTYDHAAALAYVATLNAGAGTCGFTDWRLPTAEELASVVDLGLSAGPVIDMNWFSGQQNGSYWTSTSRRLLGTDAWFVDFTAGLVTYDAKTTAKYVRAVTRGGTAAPAALPAACADATRFSVHGDGTVSDNRTGLMWKQCAEGFSGGTCTGTGFASTWADANARVTAVNADASGAGLGYADWRLPTRAELSSITEREQCVAPSSNLTAFPNAPRSSFWTGTPVGFNTSLAWSVDFEEGGVATTTKTSPVLRTRLVRAGQ